MANGWEKESITAQLFNKSVQLQVKEILPLDQRQGVRCHALFEMALCCDLWLHSDLHWCRAGAYSECDFEHLQNCNWFFWSHEWTSAVDEYCLRCLSLWSGPCIPCWLHVAGRIRVSKPTLLIFSEAKGTFPSSWRWFKPLPPFSILILMKFFLISAKIKECKNQNLSTNRE